MIESLKNAQVENRFSSFGAAETKVRLLEELETAQRREALDLQDELRQNIGDAEDRGEKARSDVEVVNEKIRILRAEMVNADVTKSRLAPEHAKAMEDFMMQLEKAERKSRLNVAAAAAGGDKVGFERFYVAVECIK